MKIQDFRGPPKVTLLSLLLAQQTKIYNAFSLCVLGEEVKTLGYDKRWWGCGVSPCRVFHLSVRPRSIEVTMPPQRLEANRAMTADLHWSSPAPWPRAGSPGCPSHRVSPPSWMQRRKTALSAPCQPCLLSPLHPPLPPPRPPPTLSPPRPLAPACLQQLRPADWGSSQHQGMWRAGVGGTARSLSLTPAAASPSAWMMTASAPQTSSSVKSRLLCGSVGTCFKMNVTGNNSIPC